MGHHLADLTPDHIAAFFKLLTTVQFTFGTSIGLSKVAICLLLLRIFFVPAFKRVAWVVTAYCIAWIIMVILIGAFLCRPFAFNWDKTLIGTCGQLDPAFISIAATDIIGDLMIICLPMPWVWSLNTSMHVKVGVSFVFSLGLVEVCISVLRIVTLFQIDFTGDFTWLSAPCYSFSIVEPSLGVIIACAPMLKPLFGRWLPILGFSTFNTGDSHRRSQRLAAIGGANVRYDQKNGRPSAKNNYSQMSNSEYPLCDIENTGDGHGGDYSHKSGTQTTVHAMPKNPFENDGRIGVDHETTVSPGSAR